MTRLAALLLFVAVTVWSQTTQGLISGRIYDQKTAAAIPKAHIVARHIETGEPADADSAEDGSYALLRLSPGRYYLVVTSERQPPYQPREAFEIELFVAGRVELNIPLRQLADTYGKGFYSGSYLPSTDAIVHIYAADLASTYSEPLSLLLGSSGTLLSTLSYVVDPQQVQNLPLAGRDIYTMLVTLPGVTADNATARGLGLSVNGQRSSSSNFLLDGVENNDMLLSGPLTVIAPEAVEEYRVSTNNFSAEYGRTGGFVANAVTRRGGNSLHGVAYGYLNDAALNANSYQHVAGLNTVTSERGDEPVPRQPETDLHAGFWAGGPLQKDRLFASAAYEWFQSRGSADPFQVRVPLANRVKQCGGAPVAVQFLTEYPAPVPASALTAPFTCDDPKVDNLTVPIEGRAPLQFNRHLALGRIDEVKGSQRWLGRVAISRFDQPDFAYYSVYPGFSPTLNVNSTGVTLGHVWEINPSTTNEARFAFTNASQGWDRPHPEVPDLLVMRTSGQEIPVSLPGSSDTFDVRYRVNSGEWNDVLSLVRGRHVLAVGGGLIVAHSDSNVSQNRDGQYLFSFDEFLADNPDQLNVAVGRTGPCAELDVNRAPNFNRTYSTTQFYGFAQDNVKITSRLGINLGVRYESFGAPKALGAQDAYFQLGSGSSITERLANGSFVSDPQGERTAYHPDRNNWAGRFGIFYDVSGRGQTVIRAAYGIFYDRPFDALTLSTRDNNIDVANILVPASYPQPIPKSKLSDPDAISATGFPGLVWIDGNLRTPHVQSWFAGVQHQFTHNLYFEASGQGALARRLISTDEVNRTAVGSSGGRLNPKIDENMLFRSNAASSSYTALTTLARYRSARGQFQAAYTWGHSIDNQSDPLQGTFGDFQFSRASNTNTSRLSATFSQQFNPRADRGSSDFDQRHDLVFYGVWDLGPAPGSGVVRELLEHWQIAGMAGFRSGFPFTVTDSGLPACPGSGGIPSSTVLLHPRASLLPGRSPYLDPRVPVPGGYRLLDLSAFCSPPDGVQGNLGRNAFTGPGFWNVDLSVAKSFRISRLGESGRLQFRADFFNAFNHANLANPDPSAFSGSQTFGIALLGRQGVQPSFPSAIPLDQLARQVQLQLKLIF
jgi:hypothetical protein